MIELLNRVSPSNLNIPLLKQIVSINDEIDAVEKSMKRCMMIWMIQYTVMKKQNVKY